MPERRGSGNQKAIRVTDDKLTLMNMERYYKYIRDEIYI